MRKINPVAKAIAISRRRTASLIVPNKKKYDRKKDKLNEKGYRLFLLYQTLVPLFLPRSAMLFSFFARAWSDSFYTPFCNLGPLCKARYSSLAHSYFSILFIG